MAGDHGPTGGDITDPAAGTCDRGFECQHPIAPMDGFQRGAESPQSRFAETVGECVQEYPLVFDLMEVETGLVCVYLPDGAGAIRNEFRMIVEIAAKLDFAFDTEGVDAGLDLGKILLADRDRRVLE